MTAVAEADEGKGPTEYIFGNNIVEDEHEDAANNSCWKFPHDENAVDKVVAVILPDDEEIVNEETAVTLGTAV